MARDLSPTVERVFGMAHDGHDAGDDVDTYEHRVRALIEDARDYEDGVRAPKREEFIRYYKGIEPELDEEGRSTIVATEVRDTILSIMPSLMRIFTAHEHVVEYIPTSQAMIEKSMEATEYITWVMMEDNDGFLLLFSVFKDSLIKGEGIVKWWTEEQPTKKTAQFQLLSEEQVAYLNTTYPGMVESEPVPLPQGGLAYNCEVTQQTVENVHRVEPVPPDEFRIDRHAKNIKTATLVGHERIATVSELVEMGYDKELIEEYVGTSLVSVRWSEERTLRNEGLEQGQGIVDGNGGVLYGEYFIRIDKDGDGIAELRRICVVGDGDLIISDEEASHVKFAFFNPDPEPHTIGGEAISTYVMDLQNIKSNLLRNSLDSLAATIFPRLEVVENMVNMDDVLNTEIGAPIRVRQPGSVNQLNTQFIGDAPMNFIAYLDNVRQQRTGISEASKGLDPKALQSTTVKGVDMVITGAQERIELIARILAEVGLKDLFRGLLMEVTENPNPGRVIKVRDKWVPINPDYDVRMGVRVNPSLGRGSDMDRFMILNQVLTKQEMIMSTMGPSNPMCGPVEYRNTLQDLLSIGSIKNVDRYFKAVDQNTVDQFLQQQASSKQQDPAYILATNEREKLRLAAVKSVSDDNFRHQKLETEDSFRRDKLEVDSTLKGASTAVQTMAQSHNQRSQQDHEQGMQVRDHAHEAGKMVIQDQQHAEKIAQGDRHKSLDAHMDRQGMQDDMTKHVQGLMHDAEQSTEDRKIAKSKPAPAK